MDMGPGVLILANLALRSTYAPSRNYGLHYSDENLTVYNIAMLFQCV